MMTDAGIYCVGKLASQYHHFITLLEGRISYSFSYNLTLLLFL